MNQFFPKQLITVINVCIFNLVLLVSTALAGVDGQVERPTPLTAGDTVGNYEIKGWVCNRNQPISGVKLELYTDREMPHGMRLGSFDVNSTTTTVNPAPACTTGTAYAFTITMDANMRFEHGGETIFVHAVYPNNAGTALLPQVGQAENQSLPLSQRFKIEEYQPSPTTPECPISNMTTLKSCFESIGTYNTLKFTQNVTCSETDADCGSLSEAVMLIKGTSTAKIRNKIIDGGGNTFRRTRRQRTSPVMRIENAEGILIKDLSLDEGEVPDPTTGKLAEGLDPKSSAVHDKLCYPGDEKILSSISGVKYPCAPTVVVKDSNSVKLNSVHIYDARGIAIGANAVDGLVVTNSTISRAGMLGIHVSDLVAAPTVENPNRLIGTSKRLLITNSVFSRVRTNAISIWGLLDSSSNIYGNSSLIYGNVINNNHWRGLYTSSDTQVDPDNGGQIYLASAVSVLVKGNIVTDGYCGNCSNHAVWGVELGKRANFPLSNIRFARNMFYDSWGTVFWKNPSVGSGFSSSYNSIDAFNYNGAVYNPPKYPIGFTSSDDSRNTKVPKFIGDYGSNSDENIFGHYDYRIYRVKNSIGGYWSSRWPTEIQQYLLKYENKTTVNTLETSFQLSRSPRVGASSRPLYRCLNNANLKDDYISTDKNCDGKGSVHSVAGYSFEEGYVKDGHTSTAIHQCTIKDSAGRPTDRFIIRQGETCSGETSMEPLGSALP